MRAASVASVVSADRNMAQLRCRTQSLQPAPSTAKRCQAAIGLRHDTQGLGMGRKSSN
jgi:hypothetical protein